MHVWHFLMPMFDAENDSSPWYGPLMCWLLAAWRRSG
jgi:hypothetical protein